MMQNQVAAKSYGIMAYRSLFFSLLGPDVTTVISPWYSGPIAAIQLGHYAEGHGEHYVCVTGDHVPLSEDQASPSEGQVSISEVSEEHISFPLEQAPLSAAQASPSEDRQVTLSADQALLSGSDQQQPRAVTEP